MADVIGLDHVGIAVTDLDEAVETFSKLLGRDAEAWRDENGRELDDEGNVLEEFRFAYLETGNGVALELMEPGEVGEGAIGSFVEQHGEGLHHVSFWVSPKSEFGEFFESLAAMGFATVGDDPWRSDPDADRDNVYTYVHPSDAHGTLVEFITPYRFEDGNMISLDEPPESSE